MLDLTYIYQVLPQLLQALLLTVRLSLIGILCSVLIGMLAATVLFYRLGFWAKIAAAYVNFFRNTPLLLHLFFLYYGLPRLFGLLLDFEHSAVIGLSLVGGAYMAEAWRSGLSTVRHNQIEAAQALALSRWQSLRYVVFPQAFSYSIPALGANCIFLFKETSVFTAIAGIDITTMAIALINVDYRTNELLLLLVLAYILVLLPLVLALAKIEQWVRNAEFGA